MRQQPLPGSQQWQPQWLESLFPRMVHGGQGLWETKASGSPHGLQVRTVNLPPPSSSAAAGKADTPPEEPALLSTSAAQGGCRRLRLQLGAA